MFLQRLDHLRAVEPGRQRLAAALPPHRGVPRGVAVEPVLRQLDQARGCDTPDCHRAVAVGQGPHLADGITWEEDGGGMRPLVRGAVLLCRGRNDFKAAGSHEVERVAAFSVEL